MSLYIVTCDYYHRRQNPPPTKLSHLNIHNYSCDFQFNADYILCSYKIWLSMVWFGLVWFGLVWFGSFGQVKFGLVLVVVRFRWLLLVRLTIFSSIF